MAIQKEELSGHQEDSQSPVRKDNTIHFLVASFFALLLISVTALVYLGNYMNGVSEDSIGKVGDLYMEGINNHVISHFQTLMELKLEQMEAVVNVVPPDMGDKEELYEELVYRVDVRNFDYLALCSDDGGLEMLDGDQIELTDPEPFFASLRSKEKKVAVGSDTLGNEIVMFGVSADYPMQNGERAIALVAAVPVDYISTMLSEEGEDDSLIYSNIIRKDGSFVVSAMGTEYANYFESLYARYKNNDNTQEIDDYVQELTASMEKKTDYSAILDFDGKSQQIYCTLLPYSEWHLLTILPFGILNETIESLNESRTVATLLVCAVIFIVLLLIFFVYYKMTCKQLKELKIARIDALAAAKAKSSFLSNMSHDIRTPMNAIVGMTAIAITHIDDKDQVQNCLKKIALSGKHLLGLVNDVLDMSKIESGKMTLSTEQISLREVVEGVVGVVQAQVKGKRQNFNVHIDNIVSEDVCCDSVRLNQVLLNLLSNAVKYTQEEGTIELSIYQEEAPAPKEVDYVRTHIIVRDNGIGMAKDFIDRIFDSYTRADNMRVHKTEGAGLGMAITKHIVDAMDGTIMVESELDKGSEFHVVLDLEKASVQEEDMVLPAWRMLVVDDDEILCHTAVDALKSIGIQADWTLSGETALEMVTKQYRLHDAYQIVLLDWKLPGMDGLTVARRIRQIIGDDMPIILISAYDWSDLEAEAREAGINGFISKPLFKSTLFYGLKKYMGIEETQSDTGADQALLGRRILVAEDNDLNWEVLHELLSDLGMELEWAENGQICFRKFEESAVGFYDAILMDVRMPVMGGYECTRQIRALDRSDAQTIPIIAMTADAFAEDIKRCLDSGMNAHTSKPINLEEILSLLKKYILAN